MLADELKALLQQVRDDSAAHAGHAGAQSGAHFAVTVVAEKFAGRRLLERHRLVYEAAAPLMRSGIHALQISALTPAEAAAQGQPSS